MNIEQLAKQVSLRKLVTELGWDEVKKHALNSLVHKESTIRYSKKRHSGDPNKSAEEVKELRRESFKEVHQEILDKYGRDEV